MFTMDQVRTVAAIEANAAKDADEQGLTGAEQHAWVFLAKLDVLGLLGDAAAAGGDANASSASRDTQVEAT